MDKSQLKELILQHLQGYTELMGEYQYGIPEDQLDEVADSLAEELSAEHEDEDNT